MKKNMIYVLIVGFLVFIAACDDSPELGDNSDNIEGFTTVYLYSSTDNYYEADWRVGSDTDSDGICNTYSYEPDDVDVTVTSTQWDDLAENMTASSIMIKQAVVTFNHVDSTMDVPPSKTLGMDVEVKAGASTTFPVRIINREDKNSSSSLLSAEDEYTVQITLTGVEMMTGVDQNITCQFTLLYTDLANSCTAAP